MAKYTYARAPNGRQEHFTEDRKMTLCGMSCGMMHKYDNNPSYGDKKVRPLCVGCRIESERRKG